ncbi:peptide chain release factor N(5)-glutamine methyltransferase [Jongsikchunia kroppenstedtii]|uniref:peptide chain release factor N(5)-glutamine methyltransferase n=1 Tax=Jongsikchunia kroppenstedtii TaxID=1121721 RepID=UPI00037796FE|nr:peptide chain release factor N(5)-glutamine methyltransferase [Jongsikchunia kroppenstedtii]
MTESGVAVRDLLRDAAGRLSAAGVPSPAVDAELLLADVLGIDRGRLITTGPVDPGAQEAFAAALARRCTREPLQHIIGHAWFGPLELAVGPGVFVPRPETEALLEWALVQARHTSPAIAVDLCSGSGALAIALAHELPNVRVHALELSDEALVWLRRNVSAQPADIADRIIMQQVDVTDRDAVVAAVGASTAGLIVSNPPYIPTGAADGLDPEVREHDPHAALFGGTDGMSVIGPMAAAIAAIARPGAPVAIEHDDTTGDRVAAVLRTTGFDDVAGRTDLAGRPRFVTGRAPVSVDVEGSGS